jgi:hypothetical protein
MSHNVRIDVRAVDAGITGGIVGAKHLFLVITDKVGNQYGARGGPDVPGGFFALIETDFGRYEKGLFPDLRSERAVADCSQWCRRVREERLCLRCLS